MGDDRANVVVIDLLRTDDPLVPERETLDGAADVTALDASHEDELAGRIEHADALILYHKTPMLSARTIDRLSRCRVIAKGGVGYDNVDGAAARRRNIPVTNVPDYGTEDVADSAIGMTREDPKGDRIPKNALAVLGGLYNGCGEGQHRAGRWRYGLGMSMGAQKLSYAARFWCIACRF